MGAVVSTIRNELGRPGNPTVRVQVDEELLDRWLDKNDAHLQRNVRVMTEEDPLRNSAVDAPVRKADYIDEPVESRNQQPGPSIDISTSTMSSAQGKPNEKRILEKQSKGKEAANRSVGESTTSTVVTQNFIYVRDQKSSVEKDYRNDGLAVVGDVKISAPRVEHIDPESAGGERTTCVDAIAAGNVSTQEVDPEPALRGRKSSAKDTDKIKCETVRDSRKRSVGGSVRNKAGEDRQYFKRTADGIDPKKARQDRESSSMNAGEESSIEAAVEVDGKTSNKDGNSSERDAGRIYFKTARGVWYSSVEDSDQIDSMTEDGNSIVKVERKDDSEVVKTPEQHERIDPETACKGQKSPTKNCFKTDRMTPFEDSKFYEEVGDEIDFQTASEGRRNTQQNPDKSDSITNRVGRNSPAYNDVKIEDNKSFLDTVVDVDCTGVGEDRKTLEPKIDQVNSKRARRFLNISAPNLKQIEPRTVALVGQCRKSMRKTDVLIENNAASEDGKLPDHNTDRIDSSTDRENVISFEHNLKKLYPKTFRISHTSCKKTGVRVDRKTESGAGARKSTVKNIGKTALGKPKSFVCLKCDKTFTRNWSLERHLHWHTGDKSQQCNVCDRRFAQKATLTAHLLTHTGVKPYDCLQCGKSYTQRSALNVHIRSHTGERPHACVVCGKSFAAACDLSKHMATHTGVKRFVCPDCDESFAQNCNLKRHMRKHTGERPFGCLECGLAFTQKQHVIKHMRTHKIA